MGDGLTRMDQMRVLCKKMGQPVPVARVFKTKEEMENALSRVPAGLCSADHTDFLQGVMPYYGVFDHLEEFGLSDEEYDAIMDTVNHCLVEFGKLCPEDGKGDRFADILAQFNKDPIGAYNMFNERGFSASVIETGKTDDAISCMSGRETLEGTPEAFEEAGITLEDLKALAALDMSQTPEG